MENRGAIASSPFGSAPDSLQYTTYLSTVKTAISQLVVADIVYQETRHPSMEQPDIGPTAQAQPQSQDPAAATPQPAEHPSPSPAGQTTTPAKPVHSLVIDANAIIRNDPTVSTLLAQAEDLYTIPAVISESSSLPRHPLQDVCSRIRSSRRSSEIQIPDYLVTIPETTNPET